jgi:ketopantoate reductase
MNGSGSELCVIGAGATGCALGLRLACQGPLAAGPGAAG